MNSDPTFAPPCAFAGAYSGKRVLVTGHTGFKGAWLCEWLLSLGAQVTGLALPPPTQPSLFEQLALAQRVRSIIGDLRDLALVQRIVNEVRPDFIFHLAAQSLVRVSYQQPVETFTTNVVGTVHVLEAVRQALRPCALVVVTTDKCYENKEWVHSYREEDPMGGHDPYSASKGAAELAVATYRRSYFSTPDGPVKLASARAGNVVGGGDWASDRIVPDCIRALQSGQVISVRHPSATRPWQHVLEPLSGYLWLGTALAAKNAAAFPWPEAAYASGFNFGPGVASNRAVADLVQEILKYWPGQWKDRSDPRAVHEAGRLNLAIDKAFHLLRWQPVWPFATTMEKTVAWYREVSANPAAAAPLTRDQIADYTSAAAALGLPWAAVKT